MFVYIKSESNLWTVGHYNPKTGNWIPENDYGDRETAAERVHWLNGGDEKKFNKPRKVTRKVCPCCDDSTCQRCGGYGGYTKGE